MQRIYTTPGGEVYTLFTDALSKEHILIAGTTGCGKSTVMNGLIATILHRAPGPEEGNAQMILIDPKRVELCAYKDMPHTLAHVGGQNCAGFAGALKMACDIMDLRYSELERSGAREYKGGNIYVIIDEWASLYSKYNPNRGECITALLRLTSEGRAARVHVILATQSPKANILPTEIRDNFTCRFALMTQSRTQTAFSLTVPPGELSCENFPRPKDAGYALGWYVLPGNEKKLYKMPHVTEEELTEIVTHWRNQNKTAPYAQDNTRKKRSIWAAIKRIRT